MSNGAQEFLKDGAITLEGGQDNGRSPSIIQRNQVAFATNTTFRGGFAAPRPGLKKRVLNFNQNGALTAAFEGGRFQHAAFYDGNGFPSLMSSHGGRQFKIDLTTFNVSEISPMGGYNSSLLRIGWSVQAENYWIYQDNQSLPIIFDGASSRRANPANNEIPVGNVMAYVNARIVVALRDSQSFRAGNLLFGKTGTTADILQFDENNYLNEGGDFIARVFGAPSGYGPILAMKAISQTNTQLGQGPLIVFTPNVAFTVNLPFDRTVWKNLNNALQTVNPIKGFLSQNSTVGINGDIWGRSLDGIRSYIFSQRAYNQWANTPMSDEVQPTLNYDTQNLVPFASAVLFDNRLLMTISPVPSVHGVWHRGLVSLDFNILSSLPRPLSNPAWEGTWTGLRILQIVSAMVDFKERCFIYALNDNDNIELWELTTGDRFDNENARIKWTLDFPSYNCGDSFRFKCLQLAELFIDQVAGTVKIVSKYKPDQYPCFLPWDTTEVCAKYQDCGPDTCSGPVTYREQFRSKIRFHQPADDFDTQNRRRHRTAYEFQPRLEMEGYCQIKQLRILAKPEDEVFFAERTQP